MLWLFAARAILLVSPPASSALVALGRPTLSFLANLGSSIGLLPLLPLVLSQIGLNGVGAFTVIQAILGSALLGGLLLWASRNGSGNAPAQQN